jgi:hypothetical protein
MVAQGVRPRLRRHLPGAPRWSLGGSPLRRPRGTHQRDRRPGIHRREARDQALPQLLTQPPMSATDPSAHERRDPRVASQLAADLRERGLDLAELQARIDAASDTEDVFPLTDEHLQEIESIRTAISELQDAVTRARTRAVRRAVNLRWTYERIGKATRLSKGRIGQIAPRRPRAQAVRRVCGREPQWAAWPPGRVACSTSAERPPRSRVQRESSLSSRYNTRIRRSKSGARCRLSRVYRGGIDTQTLRPRCRALRSRARGGYQRDPGAPQCLASGLRV